MEMTPVSSTNLASVGYDPTTHVLCIEFRNGGVYEYYNVPESEYQGLMSASSKGAYHHQHIKGRYSYSRIT
jgi:hypothetical protein